MRILIVDDEVAMVETLRDNLENDFIIEGAYSGEEAEYKTSVNSYDLIILDYLLPDKDGVEVCLTLRHNGINSPILILTGHDDLQNKVTALDAGADDYLVKPFSFAELRARIRALLRRRLDVLDTSILIVGDLSFDVAKKIVKRKGQPITLRRKELYLLEFFMRNVGRVVTREMLLDHAWDSSNESMTNVVDVHVKYLRDKVDKPYQKHLIKTVYGLGYKMED